MLLLLAVRLRLLHEVVYLGQQEDQSVHILLAGAEVKYAYTLATVEIEELHINKLYRAIPITVYYNLFLRIVGVTMCQEHYTC